MTYFGERETIRTTAADWKKIHAGLVDDVAYAEKKWMDMLTDELYKATGKGWKALGNKQRLHGRTHGLKSQATGRGSFRVRVIYSTI